MTSEGIGESKAPSCILKSSFCFVTVENEKLSLSGWPSSRLSNMEGPAPLVSFPAGKMNRNGVTNMVEADPRRGVFQIVVTPDDMLTHLQWRPRGVSTPEDDLIIFPGEAELLPVQSCPGRVFVLKWKEGELRKFYWMQLADLDADAVFVESVNQILTEGPGVAQVS